MASTNWRPFLVVYPGDAKNRFGDIVGHIHVNDGPETFDVAGGPPTVTKTPGGHVATPTPAGTYVLDSAEHHTTSGWPGSVVPWGARLREVAEVVQYETNGKWVDASGPNGRVTHAVLKFAARSRDPISPLIASRQARQMFYDQHSGHLSPVWKSNDFGIWSWNLKLNGLRTVFFIHTTPDDENAGNSDFDLRRSHGCLHIRPKERDVMMGKGYLREGTTVIVKRYKDRWRPLSSL